MTLTMELVLVSFWLVCLRLENLHGTETVGGRQKRLCILKALRAGVSEKEGNQRVSRSGDTVESGCWWQGTGSRYGGG